MKRAATLLAVALVATSACAAAPQVLVSFDPTVGSSVERDLQYTSDANALREELRSFVITRAAPYLAEGSTFAVTFTRVTLAGTLEPWRLPGWNSVRVVDGRYPPRIELEFRLAAADGTLIREGRRTLFDIDYRLNHPEAQLSRDPLRYEKPLVAQWLAAELAPAGRAGSAP
jgi:hypothetical protein